MKLLQSVAFVAALGMSSLSGVAADEAAATEEAAAQKLEYVAEMTGVT